MKITGENEVRLKGYLTIIITTVVVYLGFRYFLPLFLPFVIAYFIAWIIRPTTEFLYRKIKIPRIIGGSISLITLLAIVGIGVYYLMNMLLKQIFDLIRNMPIYLSMIADKLDNICNNCDKCFGLQGGSIRLFIDDNIYRTIDNFKSNVMPSITKKMIPYIIILVSAIGIILIVLIAALLIVKDLPDMKERYQKNVMYQDVHKVTKKLSDVGVAYLRTQLIIMLIVSVVCVIGLIILKNHYALILGIGIAFMDALPILGSGLIFIPWSIIMLMNGNIYTAAILFTIFLLCQIIREVMEPKLLGHSIGINSLLTLISMYIGVQLFNIPGFFLGPIGLVIIMTIVKVVNEKSEVNYNNVPYNED